jgi:hypothetical protein
LGNREESRTKKPLRELDLPITGKDTIVFAGGVITTNFAGDIQEDPAWESKYTGNRENSNKMRTKSVMDTIVYKRE